ncbi:MAG: methyltransferase domain-containing protein [Acidimicrobiales bacterium]|jgi:ubiquinone/menaquinone biosynthesis C-methylase UbiE
MTEDQYTHGHHESVLRSHRWRTAENSAGFLLPELVAGVRVLDVGCGPGTISADLARRVAPGPVTAIDIAQDVIETARSIHEGQGTENLRFSVDDVYDLSFKDQSFDVVYAHQVLQHLSDPVSALIEMRRVLVDGGLLAVRDADFGAFIWSPDDPRLDAWMDLYHRVTLANGAQADAGRFLPTWVRQAGFHDATVTSSNWTFHQAGERAWWGGLWADRILHSDFAGQALAYGFIDQDGLASMSQAFRQWSMNEDGVFVVLNVEVLARR